MVEEYRGCSVEEIVGFIDESSIRDDPVDDVSAAAELHELPTELSSVTDKLIRYDVRFEAVNPRLSDEKLTFFLHIDIEVQNDYRPGYPIVKRGIYYAARDIGAQLGALTEQTDYNALQKAYSIWICNERVPEAEQNTATVYHIEKQDLIGHVDEAESNYDLMTVVILRRGKEAGTEEIFDYLHGLFHHDFTRIKKYVDISDDEALRKEVGSMSGLGETIFEKGMQQGMQQGIQQGVQQGMQQGRQEGMLKKSRDIAAKLFKMGLGIPMIAEAVQENENTVRSWLQSV